MRRAANEVNKMTRLFFYLILSFLCEAEAELQANKCKIMCSIGSVLRTLPQTTILFLTHVVLNLLHGSSMVAC
jgi:hypothetical protein